MTTESIQSYLVAIRDFDGDARRMHASRMTNTEVLPEHYATMAEAQAAASRLADEHLHKLMSERHVLIEEIRDLQPEVGSPRIMHVYRARAHVTRARARIYFCIGASSSLALARQG